jgi:hypothetical protein
MKKLLINLFCILIIQQASNAQVVCDTFQVNWSFQDRTLNASLLTDLPDETKISVTVTRVYQLDGNKEWYSVDYFYEKSLVKEWFEERSIVIDDYDWEQSFLKKLQLQARLELGTKAEKIRDNVEVRFVVPIQHTPEFGKMNNNLTGKMVREEGMRVVEKEFFIRYPYKSSNDSPTFANPQSLKKRKTYILSKRTPLMSEIVPKDINTALENSVWLEQGHTITIRKIVKKNNTIWYFIKARFENGTVIGDGWINSIALIGQSIQQKMGKPGK